jgi:hypothetical protein
VVGLGAEALVAVALLWSHRTVHLSSKPLRSDVRRALLPWLLCCAVCRALLPWQCWPLLSTSVEASPSRSACWTCSSAPMTPSSTTTCMPSQVCWLAAGGAHTQQLLWCRGPLHAVLPVVAPCKGVVRCLLF